MKISKKWRIVKRNSAIFQTFSMTQTSKKQRTKSRVLAICAALPLTFFAVSQTSFARDNYANKYKICGEISSKSDEKTLLRAKVIGVLSDARIGESSGIVASRRFRGDWWTHNDSGDSARVFLLNSVGKTRAVVNLRGVTAIDFEDIAIAGNAKNSQIYVGDIGDNQKKRDSIQIYRFAEAQISPSLDSQNAMSSTRNDKSAPEIGVVAQKMTLRYPDGAHDAETLIAAPDGSLIIVTKTTGVSQIWKTPRPFSPNATQVLVKVGEFRFGAEGIFTRMTTGGDLSSDGKRVLIRTYSAAYEWVLPDTKTRWRDVWKSAPRVWNLPLQPQGESIAYALDGRSWLLTSESAGSELLQIWP